MSHTGDAKGSWRRKTISRKSQAPLNERWHTRVIAPSATHRSALRFLFPEDALPEITACRAMHAMIWACTLLVTLQSAYHSYRQIPEALSKSAVSAIVRPQVGLGTSELARCDLRPGRINDICGLLQAFLLKQSVI